MKAEKKYLMYGIGLVLLTLLGVSLAYFVTEIVGEQKQVSVSTGDLRVVFTNGDSITGTNIEPGWSETKTFSVENKTNKEYVYNIVIEDLVNTFKTTGYLVYKLTSIDGGYNMSEYIDVPKSNSEVDRVLAYSVSIPGKTTHNYTIEIKYLNDEENSQNIDMNSTLSGNLYIDSGTAKQRLVATNFKTAILEDNPTVSERTDSSVTNTSNTTGIIYKTNETEDGSKVYYYSGNTTSNWVKFGVYPSDVIKYKGRKIYRETDYYAYKEFDTLEECNSSDYNDNCTEYKYASAGDDMYWRIIRTNEDASVRLLYSGTSTDTTEGYMGTSMFNEDTEEIYEMYIAQDSKYVGYMYGGSTSLEDNRGNTNSSTIKLYLDNWYENNLLKSYDKYISKSAIYCNDRSISDGTWKQYDSFYFGSVGRLNSDNPFLSYKCGANESGGLFESTQAIEDKFSVNTTGGGNGQLTYPIALMTADEVAFAGGAFGASFTSPYPWYYLNSEGNSITPGDWLLLTPGSQQSQNLMMAVMTSSPYVGGIVWNRNINLGQFLVRGVISVDPCAKVTGTGTPTDPYIIDESASTC